MYKLSDASSKDRRNTAGGVKLAVFFLVCLFVFSACPANAANADDPHFPFVKDGKLYSFCPGAEASSLVKSYEIFGASEGYTQKAVSASKKDGFILAWNQKTQYLYHINAGGQTVSKAKLNAAIAYTGKNYVLVQTNSFEQNKGFAFTLYSIKYSRGNKKISLKKLWDGNIDCFFSDCFFTTDGICISGGTKDDSKNNAFYITAKGIHKCFSVVKNSDFLRLLNCGDTVYAFLSVREKSATEPVIYKFTLDNYIEGSNPQSQISLKNDPNLPQDYECFFGYGFSASAVPAATTAAPAATTAVPEALEGPHYNIILPTSINGLISFIVYDPASNKISTVAADAVGCTSPLAQTSNGFYYIARDPTIEDSWYGIALFDGTSCKKIKKIQ